MSNVIRVDIVPGIPVRIKDLYQWDAGQVLEIHGSNLSGVIEWHFSVNGMEPTPGHQGAITDGVAKIAIPDSVLEKSGKLKVYIRKKDESSTTTEYVAVGMIRKAENTRGELMRTLKFIVAGQRIEKDQACDFSGLVSGTENYLQAEFVFSDEWAGRKKAATFWKLGREFPVELHGDKIATCKIPRAAVSHIEFGVSVTRMEGKEFVRTNILTVERK